MKRLSKVLSLLVVCFAAMFMLTACGGGSSTDTSIEAQLTRAINDRVANAGISITYNKDLNTQLETYLDVLQKTSDPVTARKVAKITSNYAMYVVENPKTIANAAEGLSNDIKTEYAETGHKAKEIGYTSGYNSKTGEQYIFALVKF